LLDKLVGRTRRESAVGIHSVVVIEALQPCGITSVDGTAVGMDKPSQLELVDDFLQYRVRRGRRPVPSTSSGLRERVAPPQPQGQLRGQFLDP
jgi:hypothetical protein